MTRTFVRKTLLLLLLSIAVGTQLLSQSAYANPGQPGPYGTKLNYGYFKGQPDYDGTAVFSNGIYVNNVNEFVDRIRWELRPGAPAQYMIGASFIIQTMLGGTDKGYYVDPNGPVFAEWEERVRYVDSYGGINFNEPYSFDVNSYYQDEAPAVPDDAYFTVNTASGNYVWAPEAYYEGKLVGNSITFRDTNGAIIYAIRLACANPVGWPNPLPEKPDPQAEPTDFIPTVTGSPEVVSLGENFEFTFNIENTSPYPGSADYTVTVTPGSSSTGSTGTLTGGANMQPPPYGGTASDATGDQICATLSINGTANTAEDCIVIGKKPLFQVWGGDVWAGGSYGSGGSNTCPVDAASPGNITGVGGSGGGSWGEYGVFALGRVSGFGSAAQPQFAGQPASKLTFANTNAANLGYYYGNPTPANGRCLSDMFDQFSGGGTALPSTNVSSLSSNTYTTGNVTLSASNPISAGRKVIIVSSGTVTLNGDIRYQTSGINDIQNLPQLVILAQNIVIQNNASQIDAWLSARNSLFTCEKPKPISKADCNAPLTINGPVVADRIVLNRTSGGEQANANQPAEKFNLRPEAFLQAYADGGASTQVRTIHQEELPPRY
jgi:hypothetical protein